MLLVALCAYSQSPNGLKEDFSASSLQLTTVGRGECTVKNGILTSQGSYACFGEAAGSDYSIEFDAMTPASEQQVQIWAGFRHFNRSDRYIFGMKGGLSDELYLSRNGYMGADEMLALAPLDFHPVTDRWYHFKIVVCSSRIQVFLDNETLPRIDVTDNNYTKAPSGAVTLGGAWLKACFDNLSISPLPADFLANVERKVYSFGLSPQQKAEKRSRERAGYKPVKVVELAQARTVVSLDGNWLFMPEYELDGAENIAGSENDANWHVLQVPNFWNPVRIWLHGETFGKFAKGVSDKYFRQETERCENYTFDYQRTKAAWYRQHLVLPDDIKGKRLQLHFDAVSKVAEVYVNGKLAGSHVGMFGDFTIDATDFLVTGDNLIDVKVTRDFVKNIEDADKVVSVSVTVPVTNRMLNDIAHGFYNEDPAGIWQPVDLIITSQVKVEDVFIKPSLSGAEFEVTVKNYSQKQESISLFTSIFDRETGSPLYESAEPALAKTVLKAGEERTLTCAVKNLKPRLWTPQHPNLYRFEFRLEDKNRNETDLYTVESGFRTFESKGGLLCLNGKPYWLRGGNHTPFALAPNDSVLANTFYQLMRQANVEVTRTHTTPYNELWVTAADRNGIGISHEGTWPWLMIHDRMPARQLIELWKDEYLSMLKKYRNHPSILFWTVNNEMKFYDLEPDFERAKEKMHIISDVVKEMRKIDPTRPICFDSNYRRNVNKFGEEFYASIDDGDIDDVHAYINWYDHTIFKFFKGEFQAHAKNAGRPLISQEMSTGYPNNETGHATRYYNLMHQNPQTLVGYQSYEWGDPNLFLQTQSFITGELAEALRRSNPDASGILHFALLTWFRNVYDSKNIEPYPTYYALKRALQPVLVSAELWGRHFYAGEKLPVQIYLVNDRENGDKLQPGLLYWEISDLTGKALCSGSLETPSVEHYRREIVIPEILLPSQLPQGKTAAQLKLRLTENGIVVSENCYDILLASKNWAAPEAIAKKKVLFAYDSMKQTLDFLNIDASLAGSLEEALKAKADLIILSGLDGNCTHEQYNAIRDYIANGGRVLLLNSKNTATRLYPEYISGYHTPTEGDIVNMEIPESPVFNGIDYLELRYFNNNQRQIPTVCDASFTVNRSPEVIELANQTKIHAYLDGDLETRTKKIAAIKGFPLLEILPHPAVSKTKSAKGNATPAQQGKLLLSSMLVDKAGTDPVAARLLYNMVDYMSK
jgi:hypothetical protein